MIHSRVYENKINKHHERCLCITYQNKISSFAELLEKENAVNIHTRNLPSLAVEMYKVYKGISLVVFQNIFNIKTQNCYNLRNISTFTIPSVRTVYHGTESIEYLGPKIWQSLPEKYKKLGSLDVFKREIKKWMPQNCTCRLCKSYLPQIGFL